MVTCLVASIRAKRGQHWFVVLTADTIAGGREEAILAHADGLRARFGRVDSAVVEVYSSADLAPRLGRVLGCRAELKHPTSGAQEIAWGRLYEAFAAGRFCYHTDAAKLDEQLRGLQLSTSGAHWAVSGSAAKGVDDLADALMWATEAASLPGIGTVTFKHATWHGDDATPASREKAPDLSAVPPPLFVGAEQHAELTQAAYRAAGLSYGPKRYAAIITSKGVMHPRKEE